MISTSEALGYFQGLLDTAGFDLDKPDPMLSWQAFKDFARESVECADDAMLFEVGTFTFTGEPLFQLGFTRQFTIEEDGEYVGMEQLHCTTFFQPVPKLSALESSVWSYDSSSAEEFFTRTESMPEFQIPIREAPPLRAEVSQEEV
jgi:hypothetical protein